MPLAFIDFEASGLGARSWPIEVGWAFASGASVSMLLRPDSSWSDDAWDASAEKLHGLNRAELDKGGADLRDAAGRLNAALAGFEVYSDAPDWDGFWLFRLFTAAGVKQKFPLLDFARLIRPLAGSREEAVLAHAAKLNPRRHRAGADAKHLQTIHAIAAQAGAALDALGATCLSPQHEDRSG